MLLAFLAGFWFANWGWKARIREKARTEHRLEVSGKLYSVRRYCKVCYSEGWLWSVNRGVPCDCCDLGRSWPQANREHRC